MSIKTHVWAGPVPAQTINNPYRDSGDTISISGVEYGVSRTPKSFIDCILTDLGKILF
jgi:hypothetical protein